jgi:hypothetical protein
MVYFRTMNASLKRFLLITLVTLITIVLLLVVVGLWYKYTYSMDRATPQEINDRKLASKVLIATQGSEFKNEVVKRVIDKVRTEPVYIKVIDVADLANINGEEWSLIVVIHTWEVGEPPKVVSNFVKTADRSKLVVLATSGDGNYHIEGVDGITSASKSSDIDRCVREILNKIEFSIAPKEM